jgi:anti-anti-sigma factor
MASPPSEVLVERIGTDAAVVGLVGEHDLSTAGHVRECFSDLCNEGRAVVVDVTDTTFIDSAAIHVLLDGRAELTAGGGSLVLQIANTAIVCRALDVTGVLEHIPTATDREGALALARSAG